MTAHKVLYFFFFGAIGCLYPYVNLYFKRLGLSGAEIGVLATMQPIANMVGPLLAVAAANRFALVRRSTLPLLLTAQLVPFSLLLGVKTFWPLLLVYFLAMLLQSPIAPLLDDDTLRRLEQAGSDYGRVRLWGSVGYIVAVGAIGVLSERVGLTVSLAGQLLATACGAAVAWRLVQAGSPSPDAPAPARRSVLLSALSSLADVWQQPSARWLFLAGFLVRFASIPGSNFYSIHADDLGMPESLIGASWVIGVSCEVALMAVSAAVIRRIGARGLLLLGAVAGSVRWAIYAAASSAGLLLASQALHAFTFGGFHIASVTLIHALFPPERRTQGQSAWTVVTAGMPGIAASYVVGSLYDLIGLRPLFWISALISLAGAFVALRVPADPGRAKAFSLRRREVA